MVSHNWHPYPKSSLPANVDGRNDPKDIANLFMEYFKVRSPLVPSTTMPDGGPIVSGDEPLLKVTAKQLKKVISSMRRGKSPGHDGLSIEHFKHAGVHVPRVLSMLFNLCISHSYVPEELMKTTVVPIWKNRTGDISDKQNYRPSLSRQL
ncbi:hypothetical protein PYW08_006149 [Mythimna loreyi]|uniref:Uncharacterized protein n=1 Tax=Mythimna loreyi TaxID=667449 RepID=A0ACC2QLV1_9NEOP|nr:hypothetical protein PYW08_006149 [Mythimna loreyi]